jgi:hypothetical protein
MPGVLAFGAVVGWLSVLVGPRGVVWSILATLRWLAFIVVFEAGAAVVVWRAVGTNEILVELAGSAAGFVAALMLRAALRERVLRGARQ